MTDTQQTPSGGKPTPAAIVPRPIPTPDQWYIDHRTALLDGDAGVLPGGQTCAEQRDEYAQMADAENTPAVPTLTSITPNSCTAGSPDFQLQAVGTDFTDDSVIVWNNATLSTNLVSATELEATVPTEFVPAAASVSVLVRRPQVGDSAAQTFTIT